MSEGKATVPAADAFDSRIEYTGILLRFVYNKAIKVWHMVDTERDTS